MTKDVDDSSLRVFVHFDEGEFTWPSKERIKEVLKLDYSEDEIKNSVCGVFVSRRALIRLLDASYQDGRKQRWNEKTEETKNV